MCVWWVCVGGVCYVFVGGCVVWVCSVGVVCMCVWYMCVWYVFVGVCVGGICVCVGSGICVMEQVYTFLSSKPAHGYILRPCLKTKQNRTSKQSQPCPSLTSLLVPQQSAKHELCIYPLFKGKDSCFIHSNCILHSNCIPSTCDWALPM